MQNLRLDQYLVDKGFARSRSQAENLIKLGFVFVDGNPADKPAIKVAKNAVVKLTAHKKYVSRAAYKLESVADKLKLDFHNKVVLDVGSSTGGFSDFALSRGAIKIIAVDVGKNQLHPTLHDHPRIELHEQTDIREVNSLSTKVDIALVDVSFISLRQILPYLSKLLPKDALIAAMVKPQFELQGENQKHKGVIKNESARRAILKDFEQWVRSSFKIVDKADSAVSGEKGNIERFYLLKLLIN